MLTQIQTDVLDFGEIQPSQVSQYMSLSSSVSTKKKELKNLCGLSRLLVLDTVMCLYV